MKQFNRGRDFVLQLLFGVIAIAVLAWTSVRFPVIMGRDQLDWCLCFNRFSVN